MRRDGPGRNQRDALLFQPWPVDSIHPGIIHTLPQILPVTGVIPVALAAILRPPCPIPFHHCRP